ncbi:hypothetical protein J6590_022606 [Homalodisca vitripennis]|nr:hypothetical protein J6590_022606 [Homalodisca vitripennis]
MPHLATFFYRKERNSESVLFWQITFCTILSKGWKDDKDFSKSFDCVHYETKLHQLEKCGIRGLLHLEKDECSLTVDPRPLQYPVKHQEFSRCRDDTFYRHYRRQAVVR